ncbi:conserved hypothetical protein [Brochothrix thermosphacta]|nr:conserved hypothetical protein [Brochothrix thermosphacta]
MDNTTNGKEKENAPDALNFALGTNERLLLYLPLPRTIHLPLEKYVVNVVGSATTG